ncbi:unnamed protein product [Effrenium voratum]|nr:unnamed protein product [Effrenium voratum]
MITPKKKRTDLAAPETVQEQWKKGTLARDEMAELLVASNFRKEEFFDRLQIIVTSKQSFKITRDEGWYSEAEMKGELAWQNQYDNEMEFWVCVRETGSHTQKRSEEERHTSSSKAPKIESFRANMWRTCFPFPCLNGPPRRLTRRPSSQRAPSASSKTSMPDRPRRPKWQQATKRLNLATPIRCHWGQNFGCEIPLHTCLPLLAPVSTLMISRDSSSPF